MRLPTDLCLLCKTANASKTNSHILPKFLSSKLFGLKSSKSGFEVSGTDIIGKSKIIQDSPKEDHILCPDCESFFGVLESISCTTFQNWKTKVANDDFHLHKFANVFSILNYTSENKPAIRLFVYSIFWRASISTLPLFQNINIESSILEDLRFSLLKYRNTKQSDLINNLNNSTTFKLFPIALITADTFVSETSNVLFVPVHDNLYRLVIDQFSFLLFKSETEIPVNFFKRAGNLKMQDCQIIVFSEKLWNDTIVKPTLDLLARTIVDNEKKNIK